MKDLANGAHAQFFYSFLIINIKKYEVILDSLRHASTVGETKDCFFRVAREKRLI
jgi:hypothetical protein